MNHKIVIDLGRAALPMVQISTAHLRPETIEQIDAWAKDRVHAEPTWASHIDVQLHEYGIWAFCHEREHCEDEPIPEELRFLLPLFCEAGISYVRFDCDSEEVAGLPTFSQQREEA